MAYTITNSVIGMQPITTTSTTQQHPIGTIVQATDPTYGAGEFIYLAGVASTVAGSWVSYDLDAGTTALLVQDAFGPVAVAMSANVASQYGWYQISGKCASALTAGAVADNANLYTTTTAGSVDDTVVVGETIFNARAGSASTVAGAVIEVEMSRPFVTNGLTTS